MDDHATLLKTVLADAIVLGTRLAALNYRDRIYGPEATAVGAGLEQLRSSTAAFLDAAAPGAVSVADVFPLSDEIQRVTARRRDR